MVNGRTVQEELERINAYFDNMTDEEFEEIMIQNGLLKPKNDYFKEVLEKLDNLTDEEFEELLVKSGINDCPIVEDDVRKE